MALSIPSYPNPYDSANALTNAYGWISSIALDAGTGNGVVSLSIHPSAAASSTSPPISVVSVSLGQGGFPSFADLMGDTAFATAFGTIKAKLENALIDHVTALSGATEG